MSISLASHMHHIKPSQTLAISALAEQLKKQGRDIISLSAGEPDFNTPSHICEAAITAIQQGFTRYTPVNGILELKQAIVNKFKRDNQLHYLPEQIIVTCGAKQAIFNLMQTLLNPGDEVIIPAPYWLSYPDMALLSKAKPVMIHADINHKFKFTATQLEQAITPKTKLFILNAPSNPTGIAYTKEELQQFAQVLLKYPNIIIMSDDIYESIIWKHDFYNIPMVCPELIERTVIVNGVSKAYAMTGWRIGYAAGPQNIINAMSVIQGQSTSNACSIAQYAAVAALSGEQSSLAANCAEYKKRHDFLVSELNNINGIKCLSNNGTFYAFPCVQDLIKQLPNIKDDIDLAEYLLQQLNLAVVPGTAFGAPNYLRLSYATSMKNLTIAVERLQKMS